MYDALEKWIIEMLGEGLLSGILISLIKIIFSALFAAVIYLILKITNSLFMNNLILS